MTQTRTVWTDRSRIETAQRCLRLRWLEYYQSGTGIQSARRPLPLCVGLSVHVGLSVLLNGARASQEGAGAVVEDWAVQEALHDFSQYQSALALDLTEQTGMVPVDGFDAQIAAQARELGLAEDDPAMIELLGRQRNAAAKFDDWLYREQSALVEGMVRAYARRRLPALLAEFEVLEVEREGQWELAHGGITYDIDPIGRYENNEGEWSLRFMSRPDALLRSRTDHGLYLLSYKTAATWDVRKARDAEHDMQGLSEAVDVERRLGERVLGIRYEYLLKGGRWEDKDLTRRFGINVWSQRSLLIRRYVAHSTPSRGKNAGGFSVGDQCCSWEYHLEDGSASKLSASNWHSEPVWESQTVKGWIDSLDDSQETMSAYDSTTGQEPRALGWHSRAQAVGYLAKHPLDEVFPAPMMVYRSEDQARDWVDQVEAQECRVAEGVAAVEAAEDEGERRHLLNVHFPMSRRACSYPSECPMTKVCYGGEDIQRSPLESGLFKVRVPNHPQEVLDERRDAKA